MSRLRGAGALTAWLETHGGYVHPHLDLFSELPNGDVGVCASKAIAEGDQLMLVPKSLCIYVKDHPGSKSQSQPESSTLALVRGMKLSPFLSTVLLLMAARVEGSASPSSPYLRTLPESHDCLMSWTEEEKALLQGTDLEDRKESAESVFRRQVLPLLSQHRDVWPEGSCGVAAFEWACGMVQSRAFHLVKENWVTLHKSEGTDLYLIPGIDMINHSTQPSRRSTALRLVEEPLTVKCGDPLREVTMEGYFTMKADRGIAAGEEVLHTYGDLSDAQLLQTYGFVEEWGAGEANPHNVAFMPPSALLEACAAIRTAMEGEGEEQGKGGGESNKGGRKRKGREGEGVEQDGAEDGATAQREERVAVLRRLGRLPPNVVVLPAQAPLTDELLTIAQVMLMPQEDFEEYAQEFEEDGQGRGEGAGGTAAEAGGDNVGEGDRGEKGSAVRGLLGRDYLDDPDFREAVCFALLKAVQTCMRRYNSTVQEDEEMLAGQGSRGGTRSWRQRCALRVRLGEKLVLQRLKAQVMELLTERDSEEDCSDGEFDDSEDELGSEDDLDDQSGGSGIEEDD